MKPFVGFPAGKVRFTSLPETFFAELLPAIDHLAELKVTLYVLWHLSHQEGQVRFVTAAEMADDPLFMAGLGASDEAARQALAEGLERAVQRSTLLKASVSADETGMEVYFLNSPRGRAAVEAIQQGQWTPGEQPRLPVTLELERPNVYRLYEENIGPLTPLIADALQEAEKLYPGEWIEDAVRIAVENNVRRWRYVERILQSWKEKGRDETDRRNLEEDRRKYVEGEFAEFIEH